MNTNCIYMRHAINCGDVDRVEKILEDGLDPDSNISMFRNSPTLEFKKITPLIFTLGFASICDKSPFGADPISPRKVKEIILALLSHGVSNLSFRHAEANDFLNEVGLSIQGKSAKDDPIVIQKMISLLNKVQSAINRGPFFILGHKDPRSTYYLFPKEIIRQVAVNLHQLCRTEFD